MWGRIAHCVLCFQPCQFTRQPWERGALLLFLLTTGQLLKAGPVLSFLVPRTHTFSWLLWPSFISMKWNSVVLLNNQHSSLIFSLNQYELYFMLITSSSDKNVCLAQSEMLEWRNCIPYQTKTTTKMPSFSLTREFILRRDKFTLQVFFLLQCFSTKEYIILFSSKYDWQSPF